MRHDILLATTTRAADAFHMPLERAAIAPIFLLLFYHLGAIAARKSQL